MTDLVTRLREAAPDAMNHEILREAADEIERLGRIVIELEAAAEAEAQKYEDFAVRGTDLTP